jgi:hypothetical protein
VVVRHEETSEEKKQYTEGKDNRAAQLKQAKRLNWITGIAAGAAIVSVLGLIYSFYQSRAALETDQRAWIGVRGVHLHVPYDQKHLAITVDLLNSGKTPAFIVEIQTKIGESRAPLTSVNWFRDKTLGEPLPVAPGVQTPLQLGEGDDTDIGIDKFQMLQNGTLEHDMYALIRYRDIFGKIHETQICEALRGTAREMGEGNVFPLCSPNTMK